MVVRSETVMAFHLEALERLVNDFNARAEIQKGDALSYRNRGDHATADYCMGVGAGLEEAATALELARKVFMAAPYRDDGEPAP